MKKSERIGLSELLRDGDMTWPKAAHRGEPPGVTDDTDIVYEDEHVVAYVERECEVDESVPGPEEVRVTLVPRQRIGSLMDLGVADGALSAALLNGIQQVAYRLNLQHHGFEVRAHVLPPMQQRPHLTLKIRSGKALKPSDGAVS